jgi:hypothetical protein
LRPVLKGSEPMKTRTNVSTKKEIKKSDSKKQWIGDKRNNKWKLLAFYEKKEFNEYIDYEMLTDSDDCYLTLESLVYDTELLYV